MADNTPLLDALHAGDIATIEGYHKAMVHIADGRHAAAVAAERWKALVQELANIASEEAWVPSGCHIKLIYAGGRDHREDATISTELGTRGGNNPIACILLVEVNAERERLRQ